MAFPSGARQTRNHCIAALELADKCSTNASEPALPLLYCARVRASSRRSEGENRIQKAKVEEKKKHSKKEGTIRKQKSKKSAKTIRETLMIDEGRKVSGKKLRFGTPASGKIPSLDVFSPSPSERLTKKK
jgi:hypothetical protein